MDLSQEPPSKRVKVDEGSEIPAVKAPSQPNTEVTSTSAVSTTDLDPNQAAYVSYPFSGLSFSGSESEFDSDSDEGEDEDDDKDNSEEREQEQRVPNEANESQPEQEEDLNELDLHEVIASEMEDAIDWANSVARNKAHPQAHIEANREYVDEQLEWKIKSQVWKAGPRKFLGHYFLELPNDPSPSKYMAALGCPLPIAFINTYGQETIRNFMALAVYAQMHNRKRGRLETPSNLDQVCEAIEKAENIIVLSGAGISTSLGIPDFRSEKGLYNMLTDLGLSDPQEVFDINLFMEDPSIFFSVSKKILPETTRVSPTHKFIKLLQDRNKLLRNYTQNIDNLEHYAGVDTEKLVQCHGSFATATCRTCRTVVPGESIYPEIRRGEIPYCKVCQAANQATKNKPDNSDDDDENDYGVDRSQGVLKPDITFFGEPLPSRFDELLYGNDGIKCDLLICMGTSLQVAPVSDILRVVRSTIPQIYINKTPVKHSVFDVTFLGACDDTVRLLCEKLGWKLDHEMATETTLEIFPDTQTGSYDGIPIAYSPGHHTYIIGENDAPRDNETDDSDDEPEEQQESGHENDNESRNDANMDGVTNGEPAEEPAKDDINADVPGFSASANPTQTNDASVSYAPTL